MEEKNTKRMLLEWLLALVTIFFTFLFVISIAYIVFEKIYENRIYPNIYIGQLLLGGKTPEEAKLILNEQIDNLHQSGINFYFNNQYTTILPTISSAETDLTYEIINFNLDNTVASAYAFGRKDNLLTNIRNQLDCLIHGSPVQLIYSLNTEELEKILKDNFSDYETPAQAAQLIYENNSFTISEEQLGTAINYQRGITALQNNLKALNTSAINLTAATDYPLILKKDSIGIIEEAEKTLELAPLGLIYENLEWKIYKNELARWLGLKINPIANEGKKIILGLNEAVVDDYLNEQVVPEVNHNPVDAKFNMEDNRVVEFQASRDGIELDLDRSIALIERIVTKGSSTVELVARALKSKIKTQEVNDLGIKEIIGIGHSNFSGSPVNRRHNIRNGADALHGLLIKPDEEFSLLAALGEINADTGYLPELVIKGNKTIPEYGGGLCQIGTTMFRVVLSTGLPITMRRNHSYRVSYYEPAGTDATIYDPWPDFKFINDTGNHILIQSRIEGDDLFFDFWGTPDGRIASQTVPVITNITRPEPTKYIETLDLPPGEQKCTERAHNGADTYFDYIVTYPDDEVKETRYKSHYVPWREVCLLGVEELSSATEEDTATSTEEIIE
jgi:vancomycin resistance protein YoaR